VEHQQVFMPAVAVVAVMMMDHKQLQIHQMLRVAVEKAQEVQVKQQDLVKETQVAEAVVLLQVVVSQVVAEVVL